MTVFDPSALHRLVDDPESRPFVLGLARTYDSLLAARVERLAAALLVSDVEEALDAVLSLRVSSSMTGAHELAELARQVEASLRGADLAGARARASLMPQAARSFRRALNSYLERAG